jgi:predicted Zn-ribbon and HTH transcriptional regulator
VENMKRLKQRVRDGTEKKDEVEVVRSLFYLQEELIGLDKRRITAEVETSTITSAVGDVTLGAKNHNFKGQTFKIPTNCDLCGDRIWGLSAKGFDCRDCGYTCHSKCEMKVPADCPGEQTKEERKKLKAERQDAANKLLKPSAAMGSPKVAELPDLSRSNTMNSLSSQSVRRSVSGSISGPLSPTEEAPAASSTVASPKPSTSTAKRRVMAPPPAAYVSELPGSTPLNGSADKVEKTGKMMYTFDASGDGELSVQEGRDLVILEPDGWSSLFYGSREQKIHEANMCKTRWLGLGQGPRRLQGRSRPRHLC